jgi:hypothetical protein
MLAGGVGQPDQHWYHRHETDQIIEREISESLGQPRRPEGRACAEVALAGEGGMDPKHPAVLVVLQTLHQTPGLQLAHNPRDRRRGEVLQDSHVAEGEGALAPNGMEDRGQRRREGLWILLPEDPRQSRNGHAENFREDAHIERLVRKACLARHVSSVSIA